MIKAHYIYLHGFASSPLSTKAQYLLNCFAKSNLNLSVLDLNDNDFSNLSLTRQLTQVAKAFPSADIPVTIIGSSFGGLTAAWLGEKHPQVTRLILLAPAFNFLNHLPSILGKGQLEQWEEEGRLSVYHYGEKQNLFLNYQFVTDLRQYQEAKIQRPVPTVIFHGKNDAVIPIESSRDYVKQRPWTKLIEIDSDHSLTDTMAQLWQLIEEFL
jgi:hypothetical protein